MSHTRALTDLPQPRPNPSRTALRDPIRTWGGIACVLGLIGALLSSATSASAAEPINLNARTARDLAEMCGTAPRQAGADAKINFCHGFAQGTVDMALRQAGSERPFCFPNPTPRRTETLSQFVGWVRANPDRQKLGSSEALLDFMKERFPCNK